MIDFVPVENLLPGQTAEVAELRGLPQRVSRLYEYGFREGVTVQMMQTGKACVVRLGGAKFCLRPSSRFQVLVRPSAGSLP